MLRNPEFGNVFRIILDTVTNRTIDGDLKTLLKTTNHQAMSLSFRAINKAEAFRFRQYLLVTWGTVVKFKDHEGRLWSGLITSDEIRVVAKNDCDYSFSFDFEGTLV